ncbi:MAG TPA: adenosylcobinamide-phosphate synthase CbiB [Burkholderiaceae bacterium]
MIFGVGIVNLSLLMLAGVLLDALCGEVPYAHPLVAFGRHARWLEDKLNRRPRNFLAGFLAWLLAILPLVSGATVLVNWIGQTSFFLVFAAHALLLYFCLGLRSLHDHCMPIAAALQHKDLAGARQLTQRIVSRDTAHAGEGDLSKAAVESLLENGNDAVFGTLFWFAIAGGPGALLFRLANTLDAMWGYRNARFLAFGRVAARCDDALNWLPARLTALSYAVLGDTRNAWACWQSQAPAWPSPNAGPVMASGAGALRLSLGGAASYDGVVEMRPPLGSGRAAEAHDIARAWKLVLRATGLWCAAMCAMALVSFLTACGYHA